MTLSLAAGTPQLWVSTRFKAALLQTRCCARGHSQRSCCRFGAPPPRQLPTMAGTRARRPRMRPQILGTTVKGNSKSRPPRRRRRQRFRRPPGPTCTCRDSQLSGKPHWRARGTKSSPAASSQISGRKRTGSNLSGQFQGLALSAAKLQVLEEKDDPGRADQPGRVWAEGGIDLAVQWKRVLSSQFPVPSFCFLLLLTTDYWLLTTAINTPLIRSSASRRASAPRWPGCGGTSGRPASSTAP